MIDMAVCDENLVDLREDIPAIPEQVDARLTHIDEKMPPLEKQQTA
jgi:hypothetical protein